MIDRSRQTTAEGNLIQAERCIAELQRGRSVALMDEAVDVPAFQVIQLVETLSEEDLATLASRHACLLVVSRARAMAMQIMADSNAVCLELNANTSPATIRHWAGLRIDAPYGRNTHSATSLRVQSATAIADNGPAKVMQMGNLQFATAALNLAHHAHVLPAFIMYRTQSPPPHCLNLSTQAATLLQDRSGELMMLSRANVPLSRAADTQLIVFRERHGNAEHVAIIVGQPDLASVVTVRLHSSCFTGDILGSMKCDCGEQLQSAITSMAQNDGGVVLYLLQEGRGIGLASKMLAYQLQDNGFDTIDANRHLGFEADERRYSAAVSMLKYLNINTIQLMTNNPEKIDALRRQNVDVIGRVPSPATVNEHNARYLETKRNRAGHLASCKSP